jgi:hypothetical protein
MPTAADIFDPLLPSIDVEDVADWGEDLEAGLPTYSTWTPGLAFATPGTSSIVLSTADGRYTKIDRLYICYFDIETSTFTHGTASGTLRITNLPATVATGYRTAMAEFQGFTKANFSQLSIVPTAGQTIATMNASGSGQSVDTTITTTDFPSGGSVILRGTLMFLIA